MGPDFLRSLGLEDDEPLSDEFAPNDGGAEKRFHERIRWFKEDGDPYPRLRHHALWVLHNCVAHPLLAISRKTVAVEFHELTSLWLNHRDPQSGGGTPWGGFSRRTLHARYPRVGNQAFWVIHNAIAHPLIGLFPTKFTFDLHDWTARLQNVPGWV